MISTCSGFQSSGNEIFNPLRAGVTVNGTSKTALNITDESSANVIYTVTDKSIATGTVDFDVIEMGAPFEGDTASKGLLDEMPDWVKTQIDMDDYVNYLKAPVGTWDGKTYRISIDGDCHTFSDGDCDTEPSRHGDADRNSSCHPYSGSDRSREQPVTLVSDNSRYTDPSP